MIVDELRGTREEDNCRKEDPSLGTVVGEGDASHNQISIRNDLMDY